MITDLMTRTLVIYRKTSADRDAIGAETNPTETTTTVTCYAEPVPNAGTEGQPDRDTQIGEWMVVVPPGTDVTGWDRVELEGRAMEIVAPPSPFTDVLGLGNDHIQLHLAEIEVPT